MGKEDYASTGGSLRLKGAKDGGIKKKKKSKSRDKALSKSEDPEGERAIPTTTEGSESGGGGKGKEPEGSREPDGNNGNNDDDDDDDDDGVEKGDYYAGKTEAERRFEERKRKRMDERLKREGIKSHKQRVEEYNKYLSNLSEHHDMPRIGPG